LLLLLQSVGAGIVLLLFALFFRSPSSHTVDESWDEIGLETYRSTFLQVWDQAIAGRKVVNVSMSQFPFGKGFVQFACGRPLDFPDWFSSFVGSKGEVLYEPRIWKHYFFYLGTFHSTLVDFGAWIGPTVLFGAHSFTFTAS
jgi:hypothetical protein